MRHRSLSSLSVAAALPLLALACGRGGGDASGDASGSSAAAAVENKAVAAALGGGSTLRVAVAGGRHAGQHEKKQDMPTCSIGYAGKGAWGNAASDTDDKEGLVGMDLVVSDTAAAYRGTSDFMATVYFDDRLQEKNQLMLEPKKGKGTGTVKVERRGDKATVTVDGKTADGVGVKATVDCDNVMTAE